MKRISITYTTVTSESAEWGEAADSGYLLEDEPLLPEEDETLVEAVCQMICAELGYFSGEGCFESSSGTDFYAIDAEADPYSGESTHYAVHLRGLSDAETADIADYLTKRKA